MPLLNSHPKKPQISSHTENGVNHRAIQLELPLVARQRTNIFVRLRKKLDQMSPMNLRREC